jgi:hypothetical protein
VRSFTEARRALNAIVLAIAIAASAGLAAQQQRPVERPGDADVARALALVKIDPNLASERTIKTLRWKTTDESDVERDTSIPSWLRWLVNLFRWIDQSARFLVWVAAGGLALMLIAYIFRIVGARGIGSATAISVAPTHVRDLDIRPESLPADVGGTARALWDRGDHRAALSLLYRGLLSRLVHVHHVPIRDSSTEGDCLSMAAGHLAQRKQDYTVLLVRVWQRFVYGGERVEPATVYALCHDFAPALDRERTL